MTTAFLFPGQGTEVAGVIGEWCERSAYVRRLLALAAECVGTSAAGFASLAHPRALARTEVLQPALTALTLGVHRELLDRDVRADVVAGHSVGELAACAAAGVMRAEEAIALAATRGRLMAREAARHAGGMVAVRASEARVEALVSEAGAHGALCIAAHNAPDEWVLSGDATALRAVAARTGAALVPTPGAWHSSAMAGARDAYHDALRESVCTEPTIPIACNRTGALVRDAAALPALLADQLTHPVLWSETMDTLRDTGVSRMVVCGPGKALRRFARAGAGDVAMQVVVHVVASPDDLHLLSPTAAR